MDNNAIQRRNKLLDEYVRQMRAAGYSDVNIQKKIDDMGQVFVPDVIPENFGQEQTWTGGMQSELLPNKRTPQFPSVEGIPSPDDYMSYKAGQPANRLPNYAELTGQVQPTGKFGQNKQQNIMQALSDYLANYKGKTLGYDQGLMEAGVAGMPRDYGAQLFQQYSQQREQQAGYKENAQQLLVNKKDVIALMLENPKANILISDDYDTAAMKVVQYQKYSTEDIEKMFTDYISKSNDPTTAQQSYDEAIKGIQKGESPSTILSYMRTNLPGLPITQEHLMRLYNKYLPGQKIFSSIGMGIK